MVTVPTTENMNDRAHSSNFADINLPSVDNLGIHLILGRLNWMPSHAYKNNDRQRSVRTATERLEGCPRRLQYDRGINWSVVSG